ncbi:hypothetical protein HY36_16850 [Hyphomonas atlantica]|uniref:Uncharacterized protein n=1 Tax=Hyphomonas atlantica TaxID=1280948 RepID=A0A059E1D7_9PROT|nr:hypothetical protein HY36_16850 [Hyphomonas atlantica]
MAKTLAGLVHDNPGWKARQDDLIVTDLCKCDLASRFFVYIYKDIMAVCVYK